MNFFFYVVEHCISCMQHQNNFLLLDDLGFLVQSVVMQSDV